VREALTQTADALANMMGFFDSPICRRKYPPDEYMREAIQSGRDALPVARAALAQPPKAETPAGVGEPNENEDAYIARVLAMSSNEIRAEAEAVGVEIPPPRSLSTGLRNLRLRLESALANRLEEGDREAIGWLNEGIIAIGAVLAAAPAARPGDGFVLVPREPTKAMNNAGSYCHRTENGEADEIYAAMIAAAPAADGGRA